MQIHIFEKGFNFSEDGPGNRLVYHLQGCNMRCKWCSNPEGMISGNGKKTLTTEQIVSEVLSCSPMFFEGGGVTFTGGECTLQAVPLMKIITELKDNNIPVAIESNAATEDYYNVARLCDWVITDYKHPDKEKLFKFTGADLNIIENNIFKIAAEKSIHIRIPLIHGFNDDEADFKGFLSFFRKLKLSAKPFDIEILPYHEYGKNKWLSLGREYEMQNGFVTDETVKNLSDILIRNGITVIKT